MKPVSVHLAQPTSRSLCWPLALELSCHANYSRLAVEVTPHQTQGLTSAKSRGEHEGVERLVAVALE
jgi:hypothetical protein